MNLRKIYRINEWFCWDNELYLSTEAFHSEFNVYPQVFIANNVTFSMIDLMAHSSTINLIHELGRYPEPDEIVSLASFSTDNCTFEFCRDNNLRFL